MHIRLRFPECFRLDTLVIFYTSLSSTQRNMWCTVFVSETKSYY